MGVAEVSLLRIYNICVQQPASKAILRRSARSIHMFRADFLPFTSKIVEHSRYLPMRAQQCQQSIHYSQQAYDAILQLRRERASTELPSADQAFIGRTFVNIGSACGGQADSLATYARVLAYWRCG